MSLRKNIADILDMHLPSDKWEFYYHYARSLLDEDIERYQRIDEKATKFIGLVSTVFAVFTGVVSWIFKNRFPPNTILEWILITLIILTFLALISSWSLLFRTIKLYPVPRLPLSDEIDNLFYNKDFPQIYYDLTLACRNALEMSHKVAKEKENLILKAYKDIAISAWLITISGIFIILVQLNPKDVNMNPQEKPKQEQQKKETQQTKPNVPDRDTVPPALYMLLNSKDQPNDDCRNILNEAFSKENKHLKNDNKKD